MKIFDITSKQRITNVPRDDISLRPDMYPCSLCWKDSVTLIIGWGTSVKVVLLVFIISLCCYRSTENGPEEYEFLNGFLEPKYFPLNIIVMSYSFMLRSSHMHQFGDSLSFPCHAEQIVNSSLFTMVLPFVIIFKFPVTRWP